MTHLCKEIENFCKRPIDQSEKLREELRCGCSENLKLVSLGCSQRPQRGTLVRWQVSRVVRV